MTSVKKSKKANTLSDAAFSRLMEGGESILEHLSGEKVTLRTSKLMLPAKPPRYTSKRVLAIRRKLNVSQPVFAQLLNVSKGTVCKWEQNERNPSGPSARLIQILDKHPEVVLS